MKILNEVSFQLKVILEILEENLLTISIFSNTIFILILQTAVYFFCTLPFDTSFVVVVGCFFNLKVLLWNTDFVSRLELHCKLNDSKTDFLFLFFCSA